MGLRHLFAIPLFVWILSKTLKDPKFGVHAFIVVLFCTPSSMFWGFEEWRIPLFVSLCLLISTLTHYKDRNTNLLHPSKMIICWWIFLYIFLIVSLMLSQDLQRSFNIFYDKWTKTFLFSWILVLWVKEEQDIKNLFSIIIICFMVLALRGAYRYHAGYDEIGGLAGSMMDRNDFALHLMMVLPLAYFLSEIEKERIKKMMYMGISALIAMCVVFTFSRMGFLLILTASLLMFVYSEKKIQIALIAGLIGTFIFAVMPTAYFDRINTISNYEQDASALGRINAWKVGMQMGKDNLIGGVGLDCFELPEVYHKYAYDKPHVAHNAYVQIFAEGGIFAFMSWLMLIITAIFGCLSGMRRYKNLITIKTYYKACMFSLVMYAIGAVTISIEDRELLYIIISCVVTLNLIAYKQSQLKLGEI